MVIVCEGKGVEGRCGGRREREREEEKRVVYIGLILGIIHVGAFSS
jgi:hypothetical protein